MAKKLDLIYSHVTFFRLDKENLSCLNRSYLNTSWEIFFDITKRKENSEKFDAINEFENISAYFRLKFVSVCWLRRINISFISSSLLMFSFKCFWALTLFNFTLFKKHRHCTNYEQDHENVSHKNSPENWRVICSPLFTFSPFSLRQQLALRATFALKNLQLQHNRSYRIFDFQSPSGSETFRTYFAECERRNKAFYYFIFNDRNSNEKIILVKFQSLLEVSLVLNSSKEKSLEKLLKRDKLVQQFLCYFCSYPHQYASFSHENNRIYSGACRQSGKVINRNSSRRHFSSTEWWKLQVSSKFFFPMSNSKNNFLEKKVTHTTLSERWTKNPVRRRDFLL